MAYLRNLRMAQEARAVEDAIAQGVKVRGRRNLHNLPNSWDDIPHGKRGRSWKNHRTKQYH